MLLRRQQHLSNITVQVSLARLGTRLSFGAAGITGGAFYVILVNMMLEDERGRDCDSVVSAEQC